VNNDLFKTLKELPSTGKNAAISGVVRGVFEDAFNYMKSGTLVRQVINKLNEVDFNKKADRHEFGDIYEKLLSDLQKPGEELDALAAHRTTLCIFLSITLLQEVQDALRRAGWPEDAPILVVQKASWPGEEKIVRGTLADIKKRCQAEKIASQAMIIASPALGARDWPEIARSKLYDPAFSHRFRRATVTEDAS
jgi:hypothetical protein